MPGWGEALAALIVILKPILVPGVAFVAGWLFPSPLQKAKKGSEDVAKGEQQASSGEDTSKLDTLP